MWLDVPLDIQNTEVDVKYMEKYTPEKEAEGRGSVCASLSCSSAVKKSLQSSLAL